MSFFYTCPLSLILLTFKLTFASSGHWLTALCQHCCYARVQAASDRSVSDAERHRLPQRDRAAGGAVLHSPGFDSRELL